MNIVIDTNVFLKICAGIEESGNVFSKIVRDCDKVVIDTRIIEEYNQVLHKEGFSTLLVQIKLQELSVYNKLVDITPKIRQLNDDIIAHEKDRHLIECAFFSSGIIITYERKHLYNLKVDIKNTFKISILTPSEYISMNKKS